MTIDYFVLVNKQHPFDERYLSNITFKEVNNYLNDKIFIEEKTYQAFEKLKNDLNMIGIEIEIDDGYRSIEDQQLIINDLTNSYGEEYAKKIAAIPGTSEHHTGLAVDIVIKLDGEWIFENKALMKEEETFNTIFSHLAKHGFILRYPKNKESITGYAYEPWHFRYVGEKAIEISEKGLTLEEYLENC